MRLGDYPRELLIGENMWRLRFVRVVPGHSASVLGICDPSEHTIYVRLGQTAEERLATVLHEILHALEYEGEFEVEHEVVEQFGVGLAKVLLRNIA